MIPEIGHFALFLAICLAVMQVILLYRNVGRYTAWGQFALNGLAIATLAYSFLTNDFSVAYVAQNSNNQLPAFYRFCAVWGAHEGSLLLWVFILSGWMAAISVFNRRLPEPVSAQVLAVLAIIAIGFYVFLLSTSNPFIRILPIVPENGADLNPILQDPGLAVHPPILYMGYVGFAVPFAFAIAALLSGKLEPQWARWARPWTTIAWCFLTFGIVLGSAWAYRELGWGGWWFWDPVENASFMPWLAGTALIHSLAVTEKRQLFKLWTILLAVCAFSLSLLGTFLVRSGILVSVHSFAADPQRGLFMLGFLLFIIGGSLAIYAWQGRKLIAPNQDEFHLVSRESLLLMNNILLFVAMSTVLLGTLYPLIIDVLHFGKISVGAPYFNVMFMPLMIPIFMLMAIAPLCQWRRGRLIEHRRKIIIYLCIVLMLAILGPLFFGIKLSFWFFGSLSLALWVMVWSLHHARRMVISQWAMLLAHLGVGVTAMGIICSSLLSEQRDVSMQLGDSVQVAGYRFKFTDLSELHGPNYQGLQAQIAIFKNEKLLRILTPQQRFFPIANTATVKAAIDPGLFRDLYVALGTSLPNHAWSFRIYYKPFIRWIWGGGVLMVVGGILAVLDRRYRRYEFST